MDFKDLVKSAVSLAEAAASVIPGAGLVSGGLAIAQKLEELLVQLKTNAPDQGSKDDLEAAHQLLVEHVTSKAVDLSHELRGE
jgi:hypothetical protein